MGIRVLPNSVQIGDYFLTEGIGGIVYSGAVYSRNYRVETQAQGEVAGFVVGGSTPPFQTSLQIDAFPFATLAPAINYGSIGGQQGNQGQSSTTNGYATSQSVGISKFPFASKANASDIGDLTFNRQWAAGQSSTTHGYTSGGDGPTAPVVTNNIIDRFPFASDANATDVGDLSGNRRDQTGQSSVTHGYVSGGASSNIIERFPFATNSNTTDVGDLTVARGNSSGHSSSVSGYTAGGIPTGGNVIDKFPFATNASATDVGDITFGLSHAYASGISSTSFGYIAGGGSGSSSPSGYETTQISTFPFATDASSTYTGQVLAQSRGRAAGCQF